MDHTFETGSYVYYVALGICKVLGYETMGNDDFVVLQSINKNNPLKIFVPLAKDEQVANISDPLTKKEVEKVFNSSIKNIEWNTNKRERQEQFMSILKSNNFVNILSLISCINKRNQELKKDKKHLSTFDGDILKKACRLCKETIAFAYEIPFEKAESYFEEKMA